MTKTSVDPPDPDEHGRFEAEAWLSLGISTESGFAWWKHRVDPGDALRWQRAGVVKPIDAVRWKIAGIGPEAVREWVRAQIDAREAVAWTELGFSVAEAGKNKRAGRTAQQAYGRNHGTNAASRGRTGPTLGGGPSPRRFVEAVRQADHRVMHSYMTRQWFDDEAIAWAVHGIDAADALAWKELGLTPAEAERSCAEGTTAMQVAREWWQAGIPFDEVADWLGAGLSPTEAADQRAKGVTAERAAVLRSLRRDTTLGPPARRPDLPPE